MERPEYPVTDWMPLLFYGDDEAETNLMIVSEITSHPSELPTEEELLYMLTATGERTKEDILTQSDILEDAGLLTRLKTKEYTFYGLTDTGKQFIVDCQHYRTNRVLKSIYDKVERTPDIEEAYASERPAHAPATEEYTEQDYVDSDVWKSARASTYRTLTLTLERIGDLTFTATLTEDDDNATLATETIDVDSVGDMTDDYRTMDFTERRGNARQDAEYGISVEYDGFSYDIEPTRNNEDWSHAFNRGLYIFTENDSMS